MAMRTIRTDKKNKPVIPIHHRFYAHAVPPVSWKRPKKFPLEGGNQMEMIFCPGSSPEASGNFFSVGKCFIANNFTTTASLVQGFLVLMHILNKMSRHGCVFFLILAITDIF
jgi:hypothetical protein